MTESGRQKLFVCSRVLLALVLVTAFILVIWEMTKDDRLWNYFEKTHHCRMSDRRGEWTTYVCGDGLTFSRRR